MTIDAAIAEIQNIVEALTTVKFKSMPEYPIENADPFPMSVVYLASGTFNATNATLHHNFPVINVEMHLSRVNLKQTYKQINAIAFEFPRRIVANPNLNNNVTTIVMGRDNPVNYSVRPFEWGKVQSQMLLFVVNLKILQAPLS